MLEHIPVQHAGYSGLDGTVTVNRFNHLLQVCFNWYGKEKNLVFRANLWSSLENRESHYVDVDFAFYLVIQLNEAPLQVDGARV